MGLFSDIGDKLMGAVGLGDAPQFNPQTVSLNQGMLDQFQTDIGGVRNLANTDVTGLSTAGQAGQDLAKQIYQNQLDEFNRQSGSQLATGMAGVGRFGADAGSAERMANQNMRQNLVGQQGLGAANMQNLAQGAFGDLSQQQANKFNALMALPQMSSVPLQMQTNVDMTNAGIQNNAGLANMAAQEAHGAKFGNILGTIGGIGGMALGGGPMGAGAGQMIGQTVGGLFT